MIEDQLQITASVTTDAVERASLALMQAKLAAQNFSFANGTIISQNETICFAWLAINL
jgi:hypothetical protein